MTKRKSYRQIFSTFSLILLLFIFQTNIYGYVWCFCDQENTKLEQLSFDCSSRSCSSHDQKTEEHQSHHFSQEDHAGPCLDLLTSGNYTTARQRHDFFTQHVLTLPVTPIVADEESAEHSFPAYAAEPRISQQILHHRTIVLRH
nr:hypothetical protein [uncultured Desulfuromonas sp.]